MDSVQRICPNCGTANSYDRTSCRNCGAALNLPARRPSQLPARAEEATAAAIIVGITAFLARLSWRVFVRGILPRAMDALVAKPTGRTIEVLPEKRPEKRNVPATVQRQPEDSPDVIIRGWRAWSTQKGPDRSSGSEQFEWRIKRPK